MSTQARAEVVSAAEPDGCEPDGCEPDGCEPDGCEPADRLTKSLLGYGVIAGPGYVVVSLVQAARRTGFDLRRDEWSLLADGSHGWIQVANFVVSGLMVVAFAVGLRRALRGRTPQVRAASLNPGRIGNSGLVGSGWAPRLIGVYGLSLVAAGVFRADPAFGFPAGAPAGQGDVSWHGLLHLAAGGIGFGGLAAGCFVLARRYAAENRSGWAVGSRLTGVLFLAGFAAVAADAGSAAGNLGFTAAVILVWGWLAAVALERYRQVSACQISASPPVWEQ